MQYVLQTPRRKFNLNDPSSAFVYNFTSHDGVLYFPLCTNLSGIHQLSPPHDFLDNNTIICSILYWFPVRYSTVQVENQEYHLLE